jgi:hypothetical protein
MNRVNHHLVKLALPLFILSLMLLSAGCISAVRAPSPIPPSFSAEKPDLNAIGTSGEKYYPELEADYVVFESGGTFYAINGHTSRVDYSGNKASGVLQDAINTLSEGLIWIKDIPMPTGVTFKDYVTVISADRGQLQFYGNFGHTPYQGNEQRAIILNAATQTSKPIIEWKDYLGHKVAWIVAHYKLDDQTVHQHISIETCMADMNTIITRFQVTYGQDIATVKITNANLEVFGQLYARSGLSLNTASISQMSYNSTENDCILLVDASNGNTIINLVTADNNAGRYYVVKKVDNSGNYVKVAPSITQKIDGAENYILSQQYKYVQLISDGANWSIVGAN